ncbi:hypothetical protein EUX98_g7911 [Antrodiella citrinella]|uniref:AAA+ ATPase domain-containing protein n=1 Tax=Antrodiella citrinella TaxID=2447956 RepID=A0A4S4MCN9_9APHY|nr:hypothetical protein EUX98_g7911 [Antrodiella citrinella]
MDSSSIVQLVLSALTNVTNTSFVNQTSSTSSSPLSSLTNDALLTSLLPLLFSYDWLKILLLGSAFEALRRGFFSVWRGVVKGFWIEATFEQDDEPYDWLMLWVSNHPSWHKARVVDVSSRSYLLGDHIGVPLGPIDTSDPDSESNLSVHYLPSRSETYTLWYNGCYVQIIRKMQDNGDSRYRDSNETLCVRRAVLHSLLVEASQAYVTTRKRVVRIFVADRDHWRSFSSIHKRPLHSVILEPGMAELILEDARDFLGSKAWYRERGIPFRRGYFLYGAPGSGKTSLIHTLAGELNLDVYIVSLSRAGMDDSTLIQFLSELPSRCIALMEDIDTAFQYGLNRNTSSPTSTTGPSPNSHSRSNDVDPPKTSGITLSGLLNALDGVAAHEGRLLFATSNCKSASVLDAALRRPGRMDLHVEFRLASRYQAEELFKRFYLASEELVVVDGEDEEGEKSAEETDVLLRSSESPESESPIHGSTHALPGQAFHFPRPKILALASEFAHAIPERSCSMASLQGYLMKYKTRPEVAVREAGAWAETEAGKA